KAVCGRAEVQVPIHLQRRQAHVRAIDIRDDVEHEQKWKQPQADLAHRRLSEGIHGRWRALGSLVLQPRSPATAVIGRWIPRSGSAWAITHPRANGLSNVYPVGAAEGRGSFTIQSF